MPLLRMAVGAVVAFGLDRLSKILVVHWLGLASVGVIEVQPPYLVFRMVWNRGINFGFFRDYDGRWVLVLLALLVSLLLTVWMRNRRGWLQPLAAGAVVGGALGNALDRVIYGAVVDFINMSCCGIDNPSSFNIADVFIFLGAFLLIVASHRNSHGGTGKASGLDPYARPRPQSRKMEESE
jgi:signal peptidase II